jgi:anti-sigma regulatory factor (Ser/Thr protein kinase)
MNDTEHGPVATGPPPTPAQLDWSPADGTSVTVVARARAWLRRSLPRLIGQRPRSDLFDDTELLLCELVTNAVLHGGGVVRVRLRAAGKVLRVTVCDHTETPPVRGRPVPAAERGRGMILVEALAERWGVQRLPAAGGKCVWLELSTAPVVRTVAA